MILQVARTELDTDRVLLASGTTATVGSSGSTSASRMTYMASGAVRDACRAALEERERSGGGEVDVERVFRHPRTTPLDPETGQVTGERAHVQLATAAMRVVVEVDVELGLTRAVWIGTAQDVGHAMNRQAVLGQIEGGTVQGLGLALMEEIQTREGRIVNASFTDYLLPTTLDVPPIVAELVEVPTRTRRTASRALVSRRRSSRPPRSWPRCATRRSGRRRERPSARTRSACGKAAARRLR